VGADVLVLAIDTSTPVVSIALGDDEHVRAELRVATDSARGSGARRHAELLAPGIAALCDQAGVVVADVSAIAVGVGPGMFTGLRVGVTTAKLLGQTLRVPLVAVPSLDLVAYPLRFTPRLIVAVLDARRREVFTSAYRPVPGGIQRVTDYQVLPPAELVAELAAGGDELLLAGDGVARYRAEFAELERAEVASPAFDAPSAVALVELAAAHIAREEFVTPNEVVPMYIRKSDAEIATWEHV
jgi:tRNA threonylcarbamoyladenosine biosynthesis protein TsaB